jgi:hypothetical protein
VRRLAAFSLLCTVIAVPSAASAGRSFYGWLYGTEVLPERGVELSTWVQQENGQSGFPEDETRWSEAVEVGITDQLEIIFPFEVAWGEGGTAANPIRFTQFDRFGVDLRYRLVTSDPIQAPAFVPLVRLAVEQDIVHPGGKVLQGDLVGSYTCGRVQAAVDLGAYGEAGASSAIDTFEVHPAAGFSVEVWPQLRFGAEAHAEIVTSSGDYWLAAGPNLAWTHGRFWLSASYGIGLHGIRDAPRAQWGVAF